MTTATISKHQTRLLAALRTNELKRALSRTVALGEAQTCSRCGGSGHYSRCQMYGTMCFGCSGRGVVAPKITAALCERIEARVAAGELDEYLARCARITAAKKLPDALHAAWGALPAVHADAGLHFLKCSPLHHAINRTAAKLSDICHTAAWEIGHNRKLTEQERDALAARCGRCVGLVMTLQGRVEAYGEITAENYVSIGDQVKAAVLAELDAA